MQTVKETTQVPYVTPTIHLQTILSKMPLPLVPPDNNSNGPSHAQSQDSQSPWGLQWDQLLLSLRPSRSQISQLDAIVELFRQSLHQINPPPDRVHIGGPYGAGTMSAAAPSLYLYAIFDSFHADNYFDCHLKHIMDAVCGMTPRPSSITQKGFAVTCIVDNVNISVFAAANMPYGPAQIAQLPAAPPVSSPTEARTVHLETSCAVLRSSALCIQPQVFKDMVRIADKWLAGVEFLSSSDKPSHYLIELLMLQAVRSVSITHVTPDLYSSIMRAFLSLITTSPTSAVKGISDHSMPPTFLWWPFYYDRHLVDWCIANFLVTPQQSRSSTPLVIIDIAAPFVNVAESLTDWGEFRRAARDALRLYEHRDTVQRLQDRLQSLTSGFQEAVDSLKREVKHLQLIEDSPRRWTGTVQFTEKHLNSDSWCLVTEVTLRTIVWRVNARRARSETVGYGTMIDLSLQMVGPPPNRPIDVDVVFRSVKIDHVFDKVSDHVFLQKRSEVIRNRDYLLQITVIA